MDTAREMTELIEAHRSPPAGMVFYESPGSVRNDMNLLGYVSIIERAWREMELSGALCLDGRPILYLKECCQPFSPLDRVTLQRLFWNQGVANVLVLADPTSVYIYSGLAKPPSDSPEGEEHEEALVDTLSYADYIEHIQSFYHALATGRYYDVNSGYFNPNESVDAWLLDNLRNLRNSLIRDAEALDIRNAHAIIGRILFLCYLLDRGIVSVGEPGHGRTATTRLAEILEQQPDDSRIHYLYDFFNKLKDQFNGNMFDQDLDAEKLRMRPSHMEKLTLFLGGHNVESGQRTLGFWPYDFKMIPVETISAIYQDFLGAEDPEGQEQSGAYYTPRFLAEMVVDMAIRDNPGALDWSFLDPACGSGVFLVILFNRLANRWIHAQAEPVDYVAKAKALQSILDRQIRGIDIQETACRIACFSLYLAYLDFFDPPDIQAYRGRTGRPLPKLLDYGNGPNLPRADIPVIHRGDSLAEETLSGKAFDCVIGNPPWKGRQKKQLAQKFMERAPLFLRSGGTGCFLLPSKILQNQTDTFQAEWLRQVTLKRVLQLADYSFLLFQDALCPALIALFTNTPSQTGQHMVEFNAPKFNREGLRQGIITVNPTDRKWIPLSDILAAAKSGTAPVVWKRRLWGTHRDQKFLDLLQSMPSLGEHVDVYSELRKRRSRQTKRWISGQGIKTWSEKKPESESDRPLKRNTWPLDSRFIEATSWHSDLLLYPEDTISLAERLRKKEYRTDSLYSQPPPELFRPPMVLVSHGFGKVAFCDFDVLFQSSLQSISGPGEDADLLMFLTAYLRSNLAKYFLFHTSANWATERDKVHLFELLRVPFLLPGEEFASPEAAKIVSEITERMRALHQALQDTLHQHPDLGSQPLSKGHRTEVSGQRQATRKKQVDALQGEIEPLIYRYFGLTEQEIILVEDTIRIFIPSSTPSTRRSEKTLSLKPVEQAGAAPYNDRGLAAYADTLTNTLNTWAKAEGSTFRVCAEGGTDDQTGLAMVTVRLAHEETAYRKKSLPRRLTEILKDLHGHASRKSGFVLYERDMLVFLGEQIHIVRPNILLNWTRTAALNDAARIYADVALAREEPR